MAIANGLDTGATITLGGNLATSGANPLTITTVGSTNVTTPTSGTLATSSGASIPSVAQGDLLYGSASNVLSALAKDTNATRYLSNTGTSNNAAWAQIALATGVSGLLPGANGGTGVNNGASTFTYGGNTAFSGAFTFAGTVTGNTAITFPTSGTLATTATANVISVAGTANRITVSPTTGNAIVDISAAYVGQASITTVGALASGSLAAGFTPVTVPLGGTGVASTTAYMPIVGGTTTTAALQSVATTNALSGYNLVFASTSALPVWQNTASYVNFWKGGNFDYNTWMQGTSLAAIANANRFASIWVYQSVGTGVVTISQATDAPTFAQANIFTQNCLSYAVTTADASLAATDVYAMQYRIEGPDWKLMVGQPMVLSFWVKSVKTGIFCFYMNANTPDRTFIGEYTVNVTNTWEFKTLTIPASDATLAWVYTEGTAAVRAGFTMAAGSNFNGGTAGSWTTNTGQQATTNQVNGLDSNTNIFKIQLIQLQIGTIATPFEHRTIAEERMILNRYVYSTFANGTTPANAVGVNTGEFQYTATIAAASLTESPSFNFPVQMCKAPSITLYNPRTTGNQVDNETRSTANTSSGTVNVTQNRLNVQSTGPVGQVVGDILGVHIFMDATFTGAA